MASGKILFRDRGGGPSILDNRDRWTMLIWDRWTRKMPTKYNRKGTSKRGDWSEESLVNAVKAIKQNEIGVNAAAKAFGIPKTTLKRRLKSNNFSKGSMGKPSLLGTENEKKIAAHIKKLQSHGFTPTRDSVRYMAYYLAESLKLVHSFNTERKQAGYDWLLSFLSRNPQLSIRQAEGVSIARAKGLNRETVDNYFQLLGNVLRENNLIDKLGHVFNMDETGLQLNNKPGKVIAIKGSKNVTSVTSGEKGETISVLACVNGEGTFLPPFCIMKDGHTSHTSCIEMLEFADNNDIILMSIPPHTSHWLQPLDRTFFKSLKSNYYSACNSYMINNPSRKITRLQFGTLLRLAWGKSANVDNGVSGFRTCGILPFEPKAIPDYAFLTETNESTQVQPEQITAATKSSKTNNASASDQPAVARLSFTNEALAVPGPSSTPIFKLFQKVKLSTSASSPQASPVLEQLLSYNTEILSSPPAVIQVEPHSETYSQFTLSNSGNTEENEYSITGKIGNFVSNFEA
nr:uncharacterized protein LOC111418265 [Onthophagus taurus]